jgi:Animal haem peroxidase
MPRLPHGATIELESVRATAESLARRSHDANLAFAAVVPSDPTRFDYLFPALQNDPANLLPESPATVAALSALGRTMEEPGSDPALDSPIPAAYTYLGQFIDHDITLETQSGSIFPPGTLTPRTVEDIRNALFNMRTATLDLDSVYGIPAPRAGQKMVIGAVSTVPNNQNIPFKRPAGKDDAHDLPREPPNPGDISHDRAALTGDPRNDENTIISQLHLAFLKAHNAIVDQGKTFGQARTLLRQHYQHMVLHDFLKRVADPAIVDKVLTQGPQFYDAMAEPFFLPLEFTVACYRFGHTMVRGAYNFNLNFNLGGPPSPPATLGLLFTFTALSGQLGFGGGSDTLPENWIIEWERFFQDANGSNMARKLDTKLVEPLSHLTQVNGDEITEGPQVGPIHDGARLAVRNLLRGYMLRMPTGQAMAQALGIQPLSPNDLKAAAGDPAQIGALEAGGFLNRTPLWYYVLAEAAGVANGNHLGPVGSTIVAEVFYGLVKRSEDSILRTKNWKATLGQTPGTFELADLLRLAGVLMSPVGPGETVTAGTR